MFRDVGRLSLKEIKENQAKVDAIFQYLDEDNEELAKTQIIDLLSTPNYYIRELVGKKLTEYQDGEKMDQVVLSLLGHKTYGVRAATIFYYFLKHFQDPMKILTILEMSWSDTPWETEHILHEMWTKYPDIMKVEMMKWATAVSDKQRTLAYHGMELLATTDPFYVTSCVEINLDDESIDVQKKISNVLNHVIKDKPAECLPFMREWLTKPTEQRTKTIYHVMKKLISKAYTSAANGKISKTDDFYLLTMHTINDWKNDPLEHIAEIGTKLVNFAKKPIMNDETDQK